MNEKSKINNLRVKRYSNIICRVNDFESITNGSDRETHPLDITDENNYKWERNRFHLCGGPQYLFNIKKYHFE